MSSEQNHSVNEDGSATPNRRAFLTAGLGTAAAALILPVGAGGAHAQESARIGGAQDAKPAPKAEQEILSLSKDKWRWMSERNVDALTALFHDEAVFVHMGGAMTRKQELDVIKSGGIQYKNAEIREASARIIGTTAIVLSTIRLVAVVGGNEVTNPFVVTEVFVQQSGAWKLAQLSFTRTLG